MLTSVIDLNRLTNPPASEVGDPQLGLARKVVIVNGGDEVLEMLTSVLDGGRYEIMLIDTASCAYTHIRLAQPHLVILCIRVDDVDGLRLLSMLKLDADTRPIPVLTFTVEDAPADDNPSPAEMRAKRVSKLVPPMN